MQLPLCEGCHTGTKQWRKVQQPVWIQIVVRKMQRMSHGCNFQFVFFFFSCWAAVHAKSPWKPLWKRTNRTEQNNMLGLSLRTLLRICTVPPVSQHGHIIPGSPVLRISRLDGIGGTNGCWERVHGMDVGCCVHVWYTVICSIESFSARLQPFLVYLS